MNYGHWLPPPLDINCSISNMQDPIAFRPCLSTSVPLQF